MSQPYTPLSVLIVLLMIPSAFADYNVDVACDGQCKESEEATVTISLFYDVPALNDRQYVLYNNTNPIKQMYTSRITINGIALRDKLFNNTFFTRSTNILFADRRVKKNHAILSEPVAITEKTLLPRPTQLDTLSFIVCANLTYERELRQYDFFSGDYESTYLLDTVERCENEVKSVEVIGKPIDMCLQKKCSWHQTCSNTKGCKLSGFIASLVIAVILILFIVGGYAFRRERRRIHV